MSDPTTHSCGVNKLTQKQNDSHMHPPTHGQSTNEFIHKWINPQTLQRNTSLYDSIRYQLINQSIQVPSTNESIHKHCKVIHPKTILFTINKCTHPHIVPSPSNLSTHKFVSYSQMNPSTHISIHKTNQSTN